MPFLRRPALGFATCRSVAHLWRSVVRNEENRARRAAARWRAQDRDNKRARRIPDARADCVACHAVPGSGEDFARGVTFVLPFGTIYSSNITSDPETGIGARSDGDFVR